MYNLVLYSVLDFVRGVESSEYWHGQKMEEMEFEGCL